MAAKLRNFRLDDETWEQFMAACGEDSLTASAVLADFCQAYIEGHRIQRTAPIAEFVTREEFNALRDELGKSAA